jgi:hypothetical protein
MIGFEGRNGLFELGDLVLGRAIIKRMGGGANRAQVKKPALGASTFLLEESETKLFLARS